MKREEILKRIEIEDVRIANADRNIEGLILQKNKSLDEQARLLFFWSISPSMFLSALAILASSILILFRISSRVIN